MGFTPSPCRSSGLGDSLNFTEMAELQRPTMEYVSKPRVTCCCVYTRAGLHCGCSNSHSSLDANRVNYTNTALNPVNRPPALVRFLKETKKECPFTGIQTDGCARPSTCGGEVRKDGWLCCRVCFQPVSRHRPGFLPKTVQESSHRLMVSLNVDVI